MTTRQRTLQKSAAAAIIALTAAGSAIGMPAPAQAAAPRVASTWSSLMYRSLTHDAQLTALRTSLAGQQKAVRQWTAEVTVATRAATVAQTRLTAATTAEKNARLRHAAARKALTAARLTLRTAGARKPHSRSAVTRASAAVTAATKAVATRKQQYQRYATALTTARVDASAATTRVSRANTEVATYTTATARTRQAIAALPAAATLATQAGTLSRTVVDQFRPAFQLADTTQVYGVTVNRTIAFAFKRMVDDARADGVQISGGGFRTKDRQIELRTINGCPDVWTAPSSSCRVPTAIPGRSLHELGLAIDISSGGRTISRSTKAYKWLTLHAKDYGFVNLPSEAWHWSITGG
ncbi:M15 family metallopeptidase [Actinoplanes oblitus]|uniref:M15 family metallopeptidase n=1 Tax=Actinoplanes oblitus TaxID=3040509 RepID=A0ABY8WNR0_9ACTN|nr:M15 family metallopeptidase [Actinoplanes oblitus]WIM99504.1 M15 family metallopeptidase [Actinoplanes oblitus]